MKLVVADASFCGAWILEDEQSVKAEALLARLQDGTMTLRLPCLWQYEMMNLLRSATRRKRLDRKTAVLALHVLAELPGLEFDSPDHTARVSTLSLAWKHDLSSYDAAYLELAMRFRAPLYTADKQLAAAALAEGLSER